MKAPETLALAAEYLPPAVRRAVLALPEHTRAGIQEIRLRAGRSVTLTAGGADRFLSAGGLTDDPSAVLIPSAEETERSLQAVLSYSVHSHRQELAEGYVTLACLDADRRPVRVPEMLDSRCRRFLPEEEA